MARNARERFDNLAQKLLGGHLEETLEGQAFEKIVGLLIVFGAIYGATYDEMNGSAAADTEVERRGLARMIAAALNSG